VAAGRPKKPDAAADGHDGRGLEPAGGRGFAPGAPLAELPATARRILEAARRILERDGYAGLTYEALAAESGEYKDSVRYHFGGKAGLIAAVVDSSVHDASLAIFAEARELDDPVERVVTVVGASRELPGADDAWLMWELLPHVTRREDLRELDPDGVDLDAVFGLWRRIVTASLRALAEEA